MLGKFTTSSGTLIANEYNDTLYDIALDLYGDDVSFYEFEEKHIIKHNITKIRKCQYYILWRSKDKDKVDIREQIEDNRKFSKGYWYIGMERIYRNGVITSK